jgi:hypothetical protein
MEVCRTLAIKYAMLHHTLFSGTIAMKALVIYCRVLAMIVGVHLNITRAYVRLITSILYAMIVRLLTIMLAIAKLYGAIVRRGETQETMT